MNLRLSPLCFAVVALWTTLTTQGGQAPPHFIWAQCIGGGLNDWGSAATTDLNGEAYVTGQFNGAVRFGRLVRECGVWSMFVAKCDARGNYCWVQQAETASGNGVALDGAGNVYVSGIYNGPSTFSVGVGGSHANGSVVLEGSGGFLAKYSKAGRLVWVSQTLDWAGSLAVDRLGNAYLTGARVVYKYDRNGELLWAADIDGVALGYDIAVDLEGNPYVTGFFSGTVNFGGSAVTSVGQYDVFVAKYSRAGTLLWLRQAGSEGSDYRVGSGIAVDWRGNAYVVGASWGPIVFGELALEQGPSFLARYDRSGNLSWVQSTGAAYGTRVTVDWLGDAYVAGTFDAPVSFGGTVVTPSSSYGTDMYVAKYSRRGGFVEMLHAGGDGYMEPDGIAVDLRGNALVTGYVNEGTYSFGRDSLMGHGQRDVFVTRTDFSGTGR